MNYLKPAARYISRSKLYSLINIVGLALGLAAVVLIVLWVQNELSYDEYNFNAGRTYRVTTHWSYGSAEYNSAWTQGPLAGALKQLPQVMYAVRLSIPQDDVVMKHRDRLFDLNRFFILILIFSRSFLLSFRKAILKRRLTLLILLF